MPLPQRPPASSESTLLRTRTVPSGSVLTTAVVTWCATGCRAPTYDAMTGPETAQRRVPEGRRVELDVVGEDLRQPLELGVVDDVRIPVHQFVQGDGVLGGETAPGHVGYIMRFCEPGEGRWSWASIWSWSAPGDMPGIAARAEAAGYGAVFVPDHVVFPVQVDSPYPYSPDGSFPFALDTPLYDPWVVLGTIAAATSTIKLGTGVYVLPLRHPFVTARAVTSVDVLSGGRAVLGVGAGWLAEEFTALGLDPRRRFSRLEECVDVLRALWTEEQPSYHGRHFDFEAVHFAPRPASTPHPPILLGGDSTTRSPGPRASATVGCRVASPPSVGEIEERVNAVRALRRDHGATDGFEITILFPRPTPDDLARLEDLGVDRVVVMPWNRGREAIDALEAFAATALGTR